MEKKEVEEEGRSCLSKEAEKDRNERKVRRQRGGLLKTQRMEVLKGTFHPSSRTSMLSPRSIST